MKLLIIIVGLLFLLLLISSCSNKKSLPEIPQISIDEAIAAIVDYEEIRAATIKIEKDARKITMVLTATSQGLDVDEAKRSGENLGRLLGMYSSYFSDEIERGPSRDNMGEIYDHYSLEIFVAGPYEIIAHGYRSGRPSDSVKIRWF